MVTAERDFDVSVRMFEAVRVGSAGLLGEVVQIRDAEADIRACEDTTGLRVGEEVLFTGELFGVDLGPWLLGGVFDGTGRSLNRAGENEIYLERGRRLSDERAGGTWRFTPSVEAGDAVGPGDVLGTVVEGRRFLHRVLFPSNLAAGRVEWVAPGGDRTARECVCRLGDGAEIALTHRREPRVPRPVGARLPLNRPFLTGQRVLDTLFPLALGGVAALPGGFGTGKTAMRRSLARWCDADVVVCVGCGERGNEVAEILEEFSALTDPRGVPLMERTVLIAGTSDMPAATRESGVCLGMTVAEFYRDMGYDVLVVVDSLFGPAEISEEGLPVSFGSRLRWCERAGRVEIPGNPSRQGSVTLINAVSTTGRDFSDPATQAVLSLSGACWGLDKSLARIRHFPAIDRSVSYSLYWDALSGALSAEAGEDWPELREYLLGAMLRERELLDRERAGGSGLSGEKKWALYHAETLRAVYLRQDAWSAGDADFSLRHSAALLRLLKALDEKGEKALKDGIRYEEIVAAPIRSDLMALRDLSEKDFPGGAEKWLASFDARLFEAKLVEAKLAEAKLSAPAENSEERSEEVMPMELSR
jgi:V/A-type H+-transporting ATPase subunit A